MPLTIYTFSSPPRYYALTGVLVPVFWTLAIVLTAIGLWMGFFVAPTDATQGEVYRIIFIHVPAAWMSMLLYLVMAFWAAIGWAFNARLASMVARAIAPTGALFTFLALWTGALWGKPTWGTWWVWDARLTSVLILFFVYIAYMALNSAFDDDTRGARSSAILALVGAINLPIIKFSVDWWNTLHQPASVSRLDGPSIHASMLTPLLLMAVGFTLLFFALALVRMSAGLIERRLAALSYSRSAETGVASFR